MAIDRTSLVNVFRPSGEMDDPSRFAGRKKEILALVDSLHTHGSCPIIFGERGLGKSSLAHQIARIAVGDVQLLEDMSAEDRCLGENERFIVFWISCSDETINKQKLLQRLINFAEGYDSVNSFEKGSTTSKSSIDFRVFKSETVEVMKPNTFKRLDIEEQFLAVVETIQKRGHNKMLFVIDEFDRLERTKGVASFLKNTSSDRVKFLLVGIANSISSLLSDHESLQRHTCPVLVPAMPREELKEIICKCEERLKELAIEISFSDDAKTELANAARGLPWFIHVLGQDALLSASEKTQKLVGAMDVFTSINELSRNRFAQEFSDKYTMAVGDSRQRELLLRAMSKWNATDVPLSEIYRLARKVGVSNPSIYKKDLLKKKHGWPIQDAQKGVVRFRNAIFKRYIDLRGSIYTAAKSQVDNAWDEEHR